MFKPATLYALGAFLLLEAAVIVAIPARIPRAVRAMTAGVNAIAAAAVIAIGRRQR